MPWVIIAPAVRVRFIEADDFFAQATRHAHVPADVPACMSRLHPTLADVISVPVLLPVGAILFCLTRTR